MFDPQVCEVCHRGCEHGDRYCDRCWEEISSDELTPEYVPTEEDLRDMEVAFKFPNFDTSALDNPF
jgi:predicted amidophosphoribosyltransferase